MSDTPLPRIHADVSHLLEALSSQLVIVDRDGHIVAANRAWRNSTRITDYLTAFQLVAHPDLTLLCAVRDGVAAVRRRSVPEFVIEFPIVVGNEQRWYLLRAAPLGPDEAEQVLIAHVDITDRTRAIRLSALQHEILSLTVADTPLRTTLDRLADALESDALGAHCAIVTIGPDGATGTLGAAPSLAAGLADQLEGVRTETLLHFVDSPAVAELTQLPGMDWIDAAVAHGYGNIATTPIRSRSGVNLGVLLLFYPPATTPAPNARALLAVGASLAAAAIERARTARALRERDSRLNSVFVLQPDAVFTLDGSGTIVTGNPAAEALLGEATSDFAGTRFEHLVAEAERATFRRHLAKALTGYPQRFTLSLVRPSGPRIDADTTLVPLRTDGGTGSVYLVAKDITEQLAAAERLASNNRQLRQSAKLEAVGRLTGGIAHDFNNLLTAIRGYADLLLANASITGGAREDVLEIARATTRATSLTRQVLSFSRHQGTQRRVIDVNGVVEECRSMLSRLVRADVDLTVDPCPVPAWIQADPVQIHQTIINLAVNALDAMPSGGRLRLSVGRQRAGDMGRPALVPLEQRDYVTLTVQDTGDGMDVETQAHVFEPFFTTKPEGHGTGLGLSTVYEIVQQSGGRIGFSSTPGQGTVFELYFPAAAAPCDRSGPAAGLALSPTPTGAETVLIVEDDESVRVMLARLLSASGYTVLEARHGADALLISEEHPDQIHLLLSDVVMPEMNGVRLVELIREQRPDIGVVLISGYSREEIDRKGRPIPHLTFLQKPFTSNDLTRAVRRVLDRVAC